MTEQQQKAMVDERAWHAAVARVIVVKSPSFCLAQYWPGGTDMVGIGVSRNDACIDLLGRLGAV